MTAIVTGSSLGLNNSS